MTAPQFNPPLTGDRGGAPTVSAAPRGVLLRTGQRPAMTWGMTPTAAALTIVLGGLYVFLSTHVPVWHTDVWGHLAYGREIWRQGGLPATEPLMPLSRGVPLIDTAWLSQLIGYGLYSWLGVAGLKLAYAVSLTGAVALLSAIVYRRTQSVVWTLVSLGAFAWINYEPLRIVRPQLAGLLCFALLYDWLGGGWRRRHWWCVPLLFGVWANLHGSFPAGLALIALAALGRVIDVGCRTRRMASILADRQARRLAALLALAAIATCLNPYGPRVYEEVLSVARHPNLRDLVEWRPLSVQMPQGLAAAVVGIVLFVAYRLSRRRVRASEVLLLSVLGLLALVHSRMLVWWGVVAADRVAVHLAGAWGQGRPVVARPGRRAAVWSVVSLAAAAGCVALSPAGDLLLRGRPADRAGWIGELRGQTSPLTPIDAVEYLHENPPRGLLFNTYEWGDYLLWAGPADAPVFVASHAHLVPRDVWLDYLQVSRGSARWGDVLDRYGVNTVLVDRAGRGALIRLLRESREWRVVYEDRIAVVFVRQPAAVTVPRSPRGRGRSSS